MLYAYEGKYPHYYTGAVVTPGYPNLQKILWGAFESIQLGGQPYDTYTTLRLHSPPSLLSDAYLTDSDGLGLNSIVFSAEHHTPISIYTGGRGYIRLNPWTYQNQYKLRPAFLFSFERKYCRP